MTHLSILYEDNHLLVVDKPAGLATMGSELGQPTLARQAASYLKRKYNKPGNVFVGVVSRLDRLVSGVLILARTSKAARRLSEQIRNHQIQKRYLACVGGRLEMVNDDWHEVTHWIYKDERKQRMRALDSESGSAKEARLRFRLMAQTANRSLVEVDLLTGRKHQIRVQFAELGHPIMGDLKYGSDQSFSPGIALHCHRVIVTHPTTKESLEFSSSPAKIWKRKLPGRLLEALSGESA